MFAFANHQRVIPPAVRFLAGLFLLLWIPIYWRAWGFENFFFLCDIALFLGCIGLVIESPLLISSQAISILITSFFWIIDAGWRLIFGHTLLGVTDYMFDAKHPLWLRLISLFHLVLPLVLLWALNRIGYDRRAFRFQCGVAIFALLAARASGSSQNINYAYRDPIFRRQLGPVPVHLALIFLAVAVVFYLPPHLLLRKCFAPPRGTA